MAGQADSDPRWRAPPRFGRPTGNMLGLVAPAFFLVGVSLLVIQAIILPSGTNLVCASATIASAALTVLYCGQKGCFQAHPLSTVAVLGYNLSTHSLALVAQTLGGRPLVFNLQWPERTFMLSILLGFVLLAAHATYSHFRSLQAPGKYLARHLLAPLGIFRVPGQAELWMLGFVGLASTWIARVLHAGEIEYGNVGGKLLEGLSSYQIAPAFILLRGMWANRKVRNDPLTTIALLVYFGVILVTAAAVNSRGAFAVVLFDVLIAFMMLLALGRLRFTPKLRGRLLWLVLLGLPFMFVAQDFSTAMLVVRNQRTTISTPELLRMTIETMGDSEALASAEKGPTLSGTFYSEDYIQNPFLQRITYTKYTDIQINASLKFSDQQLDYVRGDFLTRWAATLPTPLLSLLQINIDKADLEYSLGDLYDSLAYGTVVGGRKTGSSIVNSLDIFGWFWMPMMFLIFIGVFNALDVFSIQGRAGVILSPLAFLMLFHTAFASTVGDSLTSIVDGLGRGLVQPIVIYVILISISRLAFAPLAR